MSHERKQRNTWKEFLAFFQLHPNEKNAFYYAHFPTENESTIRQYKSRAITLRSQKRKKVTKKVSRSTANNSSDEKQFIDDPDELLYSVAIRELNKQNPDPRWANILISCRKENITTKREVLEKFKNLPTQTLVSLLKGNLQEEL